MSTVLDRVSPGARIAIIRLRSLGDCVLSTPGIALLKQARPDLRIGVVVEDSFAAVYQGNPDIEAILPPRVSEIGRWRPELALNLHGGATSVRLTLAARSPLRAGFGHFRFRPVYNVRIPRAQEILEVDRKVHTAEHVAAAMFFLGVPRTEIPRARLAASVLPREHSYFVVHPMASAPDKTWAHSSFLTVAAHIQERFGLEPVFIAGRGESLATFSRYRILAGANLDEIKSLLAGSALFIGNDSGPAHMAAAFGVPSIVLFGSSDPAIWGPWQTPSAVITAPGGIRSIEVSEVLKAATRLVSQSNLHSAPAS